MTARLGRQTPTFELRPDCWSCAAAECIEFYESLGPRLDPWQKHVLEVGLGEDGNGDWAAPEVAVQVQRQNGKGTVTEAVELAGLFVWGEKNILHTAHRIETSKTAFKRTVELVENSDDLIRRVKRVNRVNSEEAIELLDGATLKFRTRTESGGRGLTGDRITFDEAQELAAGQMDATVPTILARPNPQIWYTFTIPKLATQFVGRLRKRAWAGESGLAYCEWTNPRGTDLSDERALAAVNPAYGIRVSTKTLAIAKGILDEDGYARECGGIWPPEGDAQWLVITEAQWTAALDAAAQLVDPVALAVDVTPDRSWAAIGAAGVRAGGGRLVGVVDHRPGAGWVLPMLLTLQERQPLVLIISDGKLADDAERAGLVVYRPTAADEVTACTGFYDGIAGDARDVWQLGQTELTAAVAGAAKRPLGGSWAWDRRVLSTDICPLVAVSRALFGHGTPRVHRPKSRGPMVAALDL